MKILNVTISIQVENFDFCYYTITLIKVNLMVIYYKTYPHILGIYLLNIFIELLASFYIDK
jgi:hypothetical protein